jgi:TPR repeat protein
MYNVAWAYDTGNGVTQDKKMAAEWYRKAIKKGCRDAMYNLSLLYEQGAGVRRNRAVAKRLRDAYESHDET